MHQNVKIRNALAQGGGILRLAPTWVPRSFCLPGRRLKLHPDDYYAYGGQRGGIDERWFSSTTPANNGPLTTRNEGISHLVAEAEELIPFTEVVAELGPELLGEPLWQKYRGWPVFAKFFDNLGPLPHHIHHREEHARLVGQHGKPESYFFPTQLNPHRGRFPYTFFGIEPGTSRAQIRQCLADFNKGDNKITNYSRAYRLEPGTGWDVPPGLLHAPGSLCTYEPQFSSDVFSMYQSLVDDQIVPEELLWKDCPPEKIGDLDYLLELIDWELNLDPDVLSHRFMRPRPVRPEAEMQSEGYSEHLICYRSTLFSARELTVLPGRTAQVRNDGPYGFIMVQGHGTCNGLPIETPAQIRFGQLTRDEYFVSAAAARAGLNLCNGSDTEPLVMLKHFGPTLPA